MKVLFGKKLGMLQQFTADGSAIGVTAIEVFPAKVLRLRTTQKDGYDAMQLGAGLAPKSGKARAGQGGGVGYRVIAEMPLTSEEVQPGAELGIEQVEPGDMFQVTATSKGKGFQGTIKRHNFARGPMTHGSRNQRRPGSIGGVDAARVFPGQKMPGRMGAERVTTKNLEVTAIHPTDNCIFIKGAVPGPTGALVTLRSL